MPVPLLLLLLLMLPPPLLPPQSSDCEDFTMSLGGIDYTACPFNGWFMNTEVWQHLASMLVRQTTRKRTALNDTGALGYTRGCV